MHSWRLWASESKDRLSPPPHHAWDSYIIAQLRRIARPRETGAGPPLWSVERGPPRLGRGPIEQAEASGSPGCREAAQGCGPSPLPLSGHPLRPSVCPLWPWTSSGRSLAVKRLENARERISLPKVVPSIWDVLERALSIWDVLERAPPPCRGPPRGVSAPGSQAPKALASEEAPGRWQAWVAGYLAPGGRPPPLSPAS